MSCRSAPMRIGKPCLTAAHWLISITRMPLRPTKHSFMLPVFTPALPNKSQTYSVEADNAELRHYLARLTRRSRCFSRSLHALWRAVKLFVFAWNRRQLFKHEFPKALAHVRDFIYP